MKYFFYWLLFTCLYGAAAAQHIVLINQTPLPVNLYYVDSFYYGKPLLADSMSILTIPAARPFYLISTSQQQHLVKAGPGDTVWVQPDGTFSSNNFLLLNLFLHDLNAALGPLRNIFGGGYTLSAVNLPRREALIQQMYVSRMAMLRQHSIAADSTATTEAASLIASAAIAEKLKLQYKGYQPAAIAQYYKDSLAAWATRINTIQQSGLHLLLREAALKIIQTYLLPRRNANVWVVSRQFFNGAALQFLYARFLKDSLPAFAAKYPAINDILIKKNIALTDSSYIQNLREELTYLRQSRQSRYGDTQVIDTAGNIQPLQALLSSHKGKVLYLDCWASWCTPCLAEMPGSLSLQELYKGEPVAFLYLGMDKNKVDWLNRQRSLVNTIGNKGYLLINHFTSAWAKQYGLKTIPRYLLYNKKGQLVDADAPRPGDAALRQKINRLLKE